MNIHERGPFVLKEHVHQVLTPTNLIIIAFVCVTIGYVAGVLISNLRSGKPDEADPAALAAGGAPAEGLIEIARLVREAANGPMQVTFNEKQYKTSSEMNRRDRDAMEEATVELLRWLGYTPNQSDSAMQRSQTIGEPAASNGLINSAVPVEVAETAIQPAKVQEKPVEISFVAAPPPLPPVKAAPKSIVGQINDILQEKAEDTPYARRRIRLVESLNGVIVQIGAESYPDINAVPDQEIRSLIRASAAEWEKRSGR